MRFIRRIYKHELVRGAGIYLFASSINSFIPFLLLPILTRYLTPTEYGEVAIFMVLVSLYSALCGLSVHGAANRKYFDYKDEWSKLAEYIFMCITILLVSTVLVCGATIMLSPFLSEHLNISSEWIVLGVPVAASVFLVNVRLGQWQVSKKPFKYGVFQISQSLINAILSITFVTVLYMGATGRLLGIVISTMLFSILAFVSLNKDNLVRVCWKPELARDALRFGIPLIPHVLGLFLINSIDRIVISNELGLEQAGIYMVAIQVSLAVNLILNAVNQTFVPWLFERLTLSEHAAKQVIVRVTYGYYFLLAVGVCMGFWIGSDIFKLIVTPAYYPAAELIGYMILAQGFHGGYLMVTNYLFFTKSTGILSLITVTAGVLNVMLLFLFVGLFSLKGAVWALCVSKLVQWLATWVIADKAVKMPWFSAFRAV